MKHLRQLVLLTGMCLVSLSAWADNITNFGNIPVPSSLNYGNSFTSAASGTTFFDDYIFTIPDGSANSVTSSINLGSLLGIDSLQARLYSGNAHYTGAVAPGTLLEAWGTVVNYSPGVSATTVVLDPLLLMAGTYTLQIRGTVTGLAGGSYAGVLNVTPPIPELETYALLLAGLGMVGAVARRKVKH
jgi:hypothetical protein